MRRLCLPLFAALLFACTSNTTSTGSGDPSNEPAREGPNDPPAPQPTEKPKEDPATPPPPPPQGPVMPAAPMFELLVGGKTIKATNVKVEPTGTQYSKGVFYYYTLTATLEETPNLVPGQEGAPRIELRVGKTENGADVCEETRGPQEGFVQPVTALREVQINYKRWTGSSTVIAAPTTTSSGACTMTLHADAAQGNAWGEAKGQVQSGANEPPIAFEVKWFQPVKW